MTQEQSSKSALTPASARRSRVHKFQALAFSTQFHEKRSSLLEGALVILGLAAWVFARRDY